KEPFVLTAGRLWDEAKNVAALAAVAPGLPWPVRVAGEARHPGGTMTATSGATGDAGPATPNLYPLGRLDEAEMAHAFARAAIYCLPARYEPFGLSALEAGLSGCALVLGDIPSLREVWGDAAVYVPPADHGALRDALVGLIGRPDERRARAEQALARARRYVSAPMAAAYVGAYKGLRTKASAPPAGPQADDAAIDVPAGTARS
ncbi:MAG: glycosyl transferase group 1, partial [Phycisphaerales bacterium]|nr:glycosyl transferase group 1 [Phycisphaerales bacterium]